MLPWALVGVFGEVVERARRELALLGERKEGERVVQGLTRRNMSRMMSWPGWSMVRGHPPSTVTRWDGLGE